MKEFLVSIDQNGRIVLPKEVRQELAIKPGDKLKISVSNSSITLTPKKKITGFALKGRALVFLAGDSLSNATVNSILEQTRDNRHNSKLLKHSQVTTPGNKHKSAKSLLR